MAIYLHNLPVDLVLVRHGQSEGNIYNQLNESSQKKLFGRHTSEYRLTDLGRHQAIRAGAILREQLGPFDKMFCSEYIRTKETAAYMDLPDSNFSPDILIREMDSGQSIKGFPNPSKEMQSWERKTHKLARFWVRKGYGGESYADLCQRLRTFLETLAVSATGLRVLVVCHGHVIRAFRTLLEGIPSSAFESLLDWKMPNCHIHWYTRRGDGGRIHSKPVKVVCIDMQEPGNINRRDTASHTISWRIQRRLLSVADLRQEAENIPQLLNTCDLDREAAGGKEIAADQASTPNFQGLEIIQSKL